VRSKGKIFTRHGTTDIGLNIVNAKANTYGRMTVASNDNFSADNLNVGVVAASAAA
jgi:hypothetical protein